MSELLDQCTLCPHRCGARRNTGQRGRCGAGAAISLGASAIHRGEEPPISGERGSATFFFSHCPLTCLFCQNFPLSQLGYGVEVSVDWLAQRMIALERRGAHNINLVTATHFAPRLVEAVALARRRGLRGPVVWNSSGFETSETIDLLAGTVDIYLTDIKYADDRIAAELSGATGYFAVATAAARQMTDQVGPLQIDSEGLARRGVIVRHLVLPQGLAQTSRVMEYLKGTLGSDVPVSVMGQYFPAHRAHGHQSLGRRLTEEEFDGALEAVRRAGIERGWIQHLGDTHWRVT